MAIALSTTGLYDILVQKVGRKEAQALVDFVEAKVGEQVEQKAEQHIKIVSKDIQNLKEYLDVKFATKEDMANLAIRMEKGFRVQAQWMLGVCITLVTMLLGLYSLITFNMFMKN